MEKVFGMADIVGVEDSRIVVAEVVSAGSHCRIGCGSLVLESTTLQVRLVYCMVEFGRR